MTKEVEKSITRCSFIDEFIKIFVKPHLVKMKPMQRDTGGKLRRLCPELPIRGPIRCGRRR
jgi:hypothetical protein